MSEDTHVLRGINWRETFPFTNIFRSFRVAIHPSKLILALLAILLLYIGGRTMDWMTPVKYRGVPGEIDGYERMRAGPMVAAERAERELAAHEQAAGAYDFKQRRKAGRDAMEASYAMMLADLKVENSDHKVLTADEAMEAARSGKYLGEVKDRLIERRDKAAEGIEERHRTERDAAKDGILSQTRSALDQYYAAIEAATETARAKRDAANKLTDAGAREAALKQADADEGKAKNDAVAARDKAIADARSGQASRVKDLKGDALDRDEKRRKDEREKEKADYEKKLHEVYAKAESGWAQARQIEGEGLFDLFMDYEAERVNEVVLGVTHNNWLGGVIGGEAHGVFAAIYHFFGIGPRWAFGQHPIFFTLFFALFLIVWAIFGGAIARISAVHVAREEKLSIRQALRFSSSKLLSFAFAPVIPLVIILVVGLVVAVGGLLLYVPFIGEILVGIFFFLALAAGFVMTLVALGTFGGINLMYPTIAVEGSDSFDAISRSFSYVYARPWRMLWYTIVAIVYGTFTFLFVRLFIYLTLAFTHRFVGLWVARTTDGEQSLWGSMWPGSSLWHLPYRYESISLSAGQSIAAFFVAAWVFLVISFLGAYLISYFFSSSTIIYYLMRREVDATELDDVYVEQSEDDLAEPGTAAAGTSAPIGEPAAGGMTAISMPSVPTSPPVSPDAPQMPPPQGSGPPAA